MSKVERIAVSSSRQRKVLWGSMTVVAFTLSVSSIVRSTGPMDCSYGNILNVDHPHYNSPPVDASVVKNKRDKAPITPFETSVFVIDWKPEDRVKLNTYESLEERQKAASEVQPVYRHRDMVAARFGIGGALFLKLVLRTLTNDNVIESVLPEPYVNRKGRRKNDGCKHSNPNCIFTWDAYSRAMITADVLLDATLTRNIPGAIVEVGVYRGGMAAYLQSVLLVSEQTHRDFWLVDSFQGMPPADLMVSKNDNSTHKLNSARRQKEWAGRHNCTVDRVRTTFDRLGILESNVHFLEGYIQHTLPDWNVESIAVLRVDVDIYSATYDALHYLYPRLEVGGVVLFDDWKLDYSRKAILAYRQQHNIESPVQFLPGSVDPMAYWIKEAS